jgi:hypothetical protein
VTCVHYGEQQHKLNTHHTKTDGRYSVTLVRFMHL